MPKTVVPPVGLLLTAEESTGKFWRLFAPASGSSASLAVTPSGPRSMPSPPLEKVELERTLLPVGLGIDHASDLWRAYRPNE